MPDPLLTILLISINLLPIGIYLCALGLLHAAGRPVVMTGVRDFLLLAFAVSGLVINGPLGLLLHSRLMPGFVAHTHWFALPVYVVLVAALAPRSLEKLVAYNCSESTLASALRAILDRAGVRYQELPGSWVLPDRGLVLELDGFPALANTTLVFRGAPDRALYQRIARELPELIRASRTGWSFLGFIMAAAGGMIVALPIWTLARNPAVLANIVKQVVQ